MKKIGILTFHNAENYGAVLQAYALKTYLQKNIEHSTVDIIDYKSPLIELSYKYIKPLSYFKNKRLRKLISFFLQFYYLPKKINIKKIFTKFRKEWLKAESLNIDEYNSIIYGSDQIWNPILTDNDLVYFGKNYNGKKISYAASDGGELDLTEDVINNLQQFYKISCREKSLSDKLKKQLNSISTVCDPVFLLSKEEWINKFTTKPVINNYVLIYKIAENLNLDNEAIKFAKKYNKKIVQIVYSKSIKKIFCFNQKFVSAITPNEFVGYFAYADFVFTTSFHGTAFSIILEKDFYTLTFNKRSERITDLLKEVGLENRFINTTPEFNGIENYRIDYLEVSDRKEQYVNKSKEFLKVALND